ncbi:MAG: PhzF family phenazine biosynthesis protein [Pseudomonadota bacterium]
MNTPLYLVDAFTDRPFAGNPAAVCLLDGPRDAAWMQALAGELNLPETAFLHCRADGDWDLRWFTPTVEVDLCGHATLASAHVLWRERHAAAGELRFHTRSGLLTAELDQQDIRLELPADPPRQFEPPPALAAALGAVPAWAGRCRIGYVAVLADAGQVRELAPDLDALAALDANGVIATAAGDPPEYDFISRFFAPRLGIPEDPVTGAAHCALAPYWCERLGRTRLTGFQASRRGGVVGVELAGERVRLSGPAVTVHSGVLHV